MTLQDLAAWVHCATHKHVAIAKDGVGEFRTCGWRLPRARVGLAFRPDFSAAGWHHVPAASGTDRQLLFAAMIAAGDAHQAMAILRAAEADGA